MSCVVIALETDRDGQVEVSLEHPRNGPYANQPQRLAPAQIDAIRAMTDASLEDVGEALFALLGKHPAVRTELDNITALLVREVPIYLYFKHLNAEVEQLPWEALHSKNAGFLSRNMNYPISRMQDTTSTKTRWSFTPPLRVMAVLGAGGDAAGSGKISGKQQLKALEAGLEGSEFPCRLTVLSCEKDLVDDINDRHKPLVTAKLLLRDTLLNDIRKFEPHILHFFCHGTADPTPVLQVATVESWYGNDEESPAGMTLEPFELLQSTGLKDKTWLITLNCCEGEKNGPGDSALSIPFAHSLVLNGVPAVVGMREQIGDDVANVFCRSFYQALFEQLSTRLKDAPAGQPVEIHWGCALFAPRVALAHTHHEGWTVPILQTRLSQFQVVVAPENKRALVEELQQADALGELLRQAGAPPDLIDKVELIKMRWQDLSAQNHDVHGPAAARQ